MHHVENLNGSVSYGGAETLTKAVDAVLRRRSRDFANLLDDLEAHINDRNAEGRTIAMFASANGNADAVRALHGRGAKLNVQDDDGLTAVHFAVLSGDLDTLRAVVSCGGPVLTSSFCMDTPLHYAADIGRLDMVEALLDAGAPVLNLNENGDSAGILAAFRGCVPVVNRLRKAGADMVGMLEAALLATPPQLQVANVLINEGVDVNTPALPKTSLSPLALMAARGDVPGMAALTRVGANVNGDVTGKPAAVASPLTAAIQHRQLNSVRYLLDHGAAAGKADGRGLSPLYVACLGTASHAGPPATLVPARCVGGDVACRVDAVPALQLPCTSGEESDAFGAEVVSLLIEAGAPANPMPTPAQACAKSGRVALLRAWLSSSDCFPGGPDTPLAGMPAAGIAIADAVQRDHWDVVVELVRKGATLPVDRRISLVTQVLERSGPAEAVHQLIHGASAVAWPQLAHAAVLGNNVPGLQCVLSRWKEADGTLDSCTLGTLVVDSVEHSSFPCASELLSVDASVQLDAHKVRSALVAVADTVAKCPEGVAVLSHILAKTPDTVGDATLLDALVHCDSPLVLDAVAAFLGNCGPSCVPSALVRACSGHNCSLVSLLLRSCDGLSSVEASAQSWQESPVIAALVSSDLAVLQLLRSAAAVAVLETCKRFIRIALPAAVSILGTARHDGCPDVASLVAELVVSCANDDANTTADDCPFGSALYEACKAGNVAVIGQLLAKGVDVNASGRFGPPLCGVVSFAKSADDCVEKALAVATQLLDSGATVAPDSPLDSLDKSRWDTVPVVAASTVQDVRLLKRLLSAFNLPIPARQLVLSRALIAAVGAQAQGCVDVILAQDSFTPAQLVETMLIGCKFATRAGLEVLDALRRAGGDVNGQVLGNGNTPLHEACRQGNVVAVEYLLSRGARVDVKDVGGFLPLHVAVTCAKPEATPAILRMLVDAGANPATAGPGHQLPVRVLKELAAKNDALLYAARVLEGEVGRVSSVPVCSSATASLVPSPSLPNLASLSVSSPLPSIPPAVGTFQFGAGPIVFGSSTTAFGGTQPPFAVPSAPLFSSVAATKSQGYSGSGPSSKSLDFSDAASLAQIALLSKQAEEQGKRAVSGVTGAGRHHMDEQKLTRIGARGTQGEEKAAPLTAAAIAALRITNPEAVPPATAVTDGAASPASPPRPASGPPPLALPDSFRFFSMDTLVSGDAAGLFSEIEDTTGGNISSKLRSGASFVEMNEMYQRIQETPCMNVAAILQQQKCLTDIHTTFTQQCGVLIKDVVAEFLGSEEFSMSHDTVIDDVEFRLFRDPKMHPGNAEFSLLKIFAACVPGLHCRLSAVFDMCGVRVVASAAVGSVVTVLPRSAEDAADAAANDAGRAEEPAEEAGLKSATASLCKSIDRMLRRPVDTFPQDAPPLFVTQKEADDCLTTLKASVCSGLAGFVDTWLQRDVYVRQGDDGRLYVFPDSGQLFLPTLPANGRPVVPARFIPSNSDLPAYIVTLDSALLTDFAMRVVENEQGEHPVAVETFLPAALSSAMLTIFPNSGAGAEISVAAYVNPSFDVTLVFCVVGFATTRVSSRLREYLTVLAAEDEDAVEDLVYQSSGDVIVFHTTFAALSCEAPIRPELLLGVGKTLPKSADPPSMDVVVSTVVGMIDKTIPAVMSRMESGFVANSTPGRPVPLQNIVMSLKQTMHSFGLNLRYLGRSRRECKLPFSRSALLCEVIARAMRNVIRAELAEVDFIGLQPAFKSAFLRLLCVSPEREHDPDAHLELKEAVLLYFPFALTDDELTSEHGSLWHKLGDEERRVVLFQFTRLFGVEMAYTMEFPSPAIHVSSVVFRTRQKSLRPPSALVMARQNVVTTDKRFIHSELMKLMRQIVRRGSVGQVDEVIPSVLQLSSSLAYSVKSFKTALTFAQRSLDVAGALLTGNSESVPLRRLKLECLRHMALLMLRWYKLADATNYARKLCTETQALFGKDCRELLPAFALFGYVLLRGNNSTPNALKSARAALKAAYEKCPLSQGGGDLNAELRALAGSNYAAALAASGSLDAALKLLKDVSHGTSVRVWTVLMTNLAALTAAAGEPLTAIRQLEAVVQSGSQSAESLPDVLLAQASVADIFLGMGKTIEAVNLAEGGMGKSKRLQTPQEMTARFVSIAAEAHALDRNPKAAALAQLAGSLLEARYGTGHGAVSVAKARRVAICCAVGEVSHEEALMRLTEAVSIAESSFGSAHPVCGRITMQLAEVQGYTDASTALETAAIALPSLLLLGRSHPETIALHVACVRYAGTAGDIEEAGYSGKSACDAAAPYGMGNTVRISAMTAYAMALKESNDLHTALQVLEEECTPYLGVVSPSLQADIQDLRGELAGLSMEAEYFEMYGEGEADFDEDDEGGDVNVSYAPGDDWEDAVAATGAADYSTSSEDENGQPQPASDGAPLDGAETDTDSGSGSAAETASTTSSGVSGSDSRTTGSEAGNPSEADSDADTVPITDEYGEGVEAEEAET